MGIASRFVIKNVHRFANTQFGYGNIVWWCSVNEHVIVFKKILPCHNRILVITQGTIGDSWLTREVCVGIFDSDLQSIRVERDDGAVGVGAE